MANELVTAPSILFLDEPTSGLDSTTALLLVQMLRHLCDRGMTIICCIHQPRENIFTMFDRLLVLVGGKTAYFGAASGCREYLEASELQSGIELKLPPFTNIADWVLDLMNDHEIAKDIPGCWETRGAQALTDEIERVKGWCMFVRVLLLTTTAGSVCCCCCCCCSS